MSYKIKVSTRIPAQFEAVSPLVLDRTNGLYSLSLDVDTLEDSLTGIVSDFSDLSGNISINQMDSGTGAAIGTFWRGDGSWATPSGGGDLLAASNLSDVADAATSIRNLGGLDLSTTVAVTGTATITSTGFGKLHLVSGTASNYTITIPTPVGNTGALLAFIVDLPAAASKVYTISTPSGVIGRQGASFIMWASETVLLCSNGTNWQVVDGRPVPMVGRLTRTSNLVSGLAVEIPFTAADSDPTSLNLCYDTANFRFKAPRKSAFVFDLYSYQTATGPAFNQVFLGVNGTAASAGVFSWTGAITAGTIYGTAHLSLSATDNVRAVANQDGTSPLVAGATVPAYLNYREIPLW